MKIRLQVITPGIVLGALIIVVPGIASAQVCGEVLYTDTTVQQNLDCAGAGLVIGSNNITVDLNGYTLTGDGSAVGIDNSAGYNHVTIMNGEIEHFFRNVVSTGATDLRIKNVVSDNSLFQGIGILILGGKDSKIQDSVFMGPGSNVAMILSCTKSAQVENVIVDHYGVGVGIFSICPDLPLRPSEVSVMNSTFLGNVLGVLVLFGTNVHIVSNTFDGCSVSAANCGTGTGILVAPGDDTSPFLASDLNIEDNRIAGKAFGIHFFGVTDSRIANNQIENNEFFGILIRGTEAGIESTNNLIKSNFVTGSFFGIFIGETEGGIGPTNNVIKSNFVTGNLLTDLAHTPLATPNNWKNNTCNTKSGFDIPDC